MRRVRVRKPFYGWWIVAAAVVSQFAWMAAGPTVVGVFLDPVVDETGWLVWQFTLGTSLAGAMGAVSGVFAGQVVDRRGPRPLMLVGAAVSLACFLGLAAQSSLWMFLILHAALGLVGYNLFGSLVASSAVSKWFVARRGWALAVGSVGVSLAGIIAPVAMRYAVDMRGWRVGYAALGAFVALAIVPAAFAMRRAPEDYGLLPDGAPSATESPGESAEPPSAEPPSLDRASAMRTRAFWLLTFGYMLNYAALSAVLIHAIPFVAESGFSRAVGALALAVNGAGNLASKVVWGYGLQRFETRRLVLAAFSTSSVGVALMVLAARTGTDAALFVSLPLAGAISASQIMLFAGFFLYGFGFGGTIPISEFIWARRLVRSPSSGGISPFNWL